MPRRPAAWEVLIDSAYPERTARPIVRSGDAYELMARSTALLREMRD